MTSKRGRSIIISLGMVIALCGCASTGQQEVYPARIISSDEAQSASSEPNGISGEGTLASDGLETGSDYVFKPADTVESENSYALMKNEMTLSSGISKEYDYGYLTKDSSALADSKNGSNDADKAVGKETEVILTAKEGNSEEKDSQSPGGQEILSGQKDEKASTQAAEAGPEIPKQADAAGLEVSEQSAGAMESVQGASIHSEPSGTGSGTAEKASEQSAGVEAKSEEELKASKDAKAAEDSKNPEDGAGAASSKEQPAKAENADNSGTSQAQSGSEYSDEQMAQICAFYDGTVFAGDSVMLGFRNYAKKSSDPMVSKLSFLAAGSLSLHNSFWEVSSKSVHPLYQGEQHPIWESIQMMGAKKAFLFFGINDVVYNLDESMSLYAQLVEKIKEYSPNIEITIISATYTLKDKGKNKLNNANLAEFNRSAQALAAQNGWGYVDIANPLSDGEGNLAPQYCSDGFLHENNKAYDVWTSVLKKYASDRLGIQGSAAESTGQAQ